MRARRPPQLAELAAESGVGENEFVARVSTESKVTPGQTIELAFDTTKLAIFDADTGVNLTIPPAGRRSRLRRARRPNRPLHRRHRRPPPSDQTPPQPPAE